jgi:GntR family transcriptional regulator
VQLGRSRVQYLGGVHSNVDTLVQVEPSSPVPLYYQIANVLQARIFTGTCPAGALLGTEKDLAAEFGVSRITIRKAIEILHRDGLLDPRRGRGTFVASGARPVAPTALHVFLDDILTRAEVSNAVNAGQFEHAEVPASADVATRLGVQPGTPVVRVERPVGSTTKVADVWVTYLVPRDVWRAVRRALDIADRSDSLLRLIDRTPGLRLTQGREVIHAIAADAETAARLEVAPGTAVLRVERQYQTESGRTVVYGWADHRRGGIPVLLSRAHR